MKQPGAVLWVVPTERSKTKLLDFLSKGTGVQLGHSPHALSEDRTRQTRPLYPVTDDDTYVAPKYGRNVQDGILLDIVKRRRPRHIVIAVGGGIQDKLGRYLLVRLGYRPAVHSIGAAIGFLTGDQIRIPLWADRYYVGWLFRSFAQPMVFVPRFWSARKLPGLSGNIEIGYRRFAGSRNYCSSRNLTSLPIP
jgi:hypothetical protein